MRFSVKLLVLFLLLNFGALALGSWLMGDISTNEWYQSAEKAPWTPPGWAFGAAWFTLMALFAVFMTIMLSRTRNSQPWIFLYVIQWLLNVSWNPVFFVQHMVITGLVILAALLVVLLAMLVRARRISRPAIFLLLPYVLWICVAISMNAYIWHMNGSGP